MTKFFLAATAVLVLAGSAQAKEQVTVGHTIPLGWVSRNMLDCHAGHSSLCWVHETGTPLNIHSSPNGRLVGKIANGNFVELSDTAGNWVFVSLITSGGYWFGPGDDGSLECDPKTNDAGVLVCN
jgi:hypothetical protein